MEEQIRVYEVEKTIVKQEKDKKRFILKYLGDNEYEKDNKWVFHAPDASTFTEEELEIILNKLKELNKVTDENEKE